MTIEKQGIESEISAFKCESFIHQSDRKHVFRSASHISSHCKIFGRWNFGQHTFEVPKANPS